MVIKVRMLFLFCLMVCYILGCKESISESPQSKPQTDFLINQNINNPSEFFEEEYEFVLMWGETGSGSGQFNGVGSLDVDSEGNVYVQDKNNYRIQKFTSKGEYLLEWGEYGNEE